MLKNIIIMEGRDWNGRINGKVGREGDKGGIQRGKAKTKGHEGSYEVIWSPNTVHTHTHTHTRLEMQGFLCNMFCKELLELPFLL